MNFKNKTKDKTKTSNEIDLEKLYKDYLKDISRYFNYKTNDSELSKDLTQETFCRATRKIGTFKGECHILGWLRTIAKNVLIDYLREKKKIKEEELSEEIAMEFDIVKDYIQKEQIEEINEQLNGLSDELKRLILMRSVDNMSFKAIGDLLGRTEEWARITFYRTKKKIKEKNREEEKVDEAK